MNNKKNLVIILIIMLVLGIMVFNPSKYSSVFMKEKVEHKELNRSTFAIYKELTQNGKDWALSEDTKFPDKGYILNTTKTECRGYSGDAIPNTLTQNDDMSITISSNKTIYCNIYFDKDDTVPVVNKFEIIGRDSQNQELRNGYTYQYGVTYEIGWLDTDVKEYCISSDISNCNGEWTKTNGLTSITTDTIDLADGEGLKTMYLFIKDKANNISSITDISTKQITVDQTPPEVKALTLTGKDSNNGNLTNGFTYNTTINYKAEWDNNDVVSICVNNVAECSNYELTNGLQEKSASIGLQTGEGKKTVYAYLKDNANNISVVKSTDITVDRTLPVINTFTIVGKSVSGVTLTDSNLYSHTVNVGYTFNWTELNTSAYCITSSASCGSNDWVTINATSVTNAVKTLATGDGNKTMNAFVKDKANNVSAVASDSIMLDLTAPTVTIAKSSVTTESITVTLGGSDGSGSGINSYQCRIASINNGNWETAVLTGGKYQCTISGLNDGTTYEVEGRTIDNSGRISAIQSVIDTTENALTECQKQALEILKVIPNGISEDLLGDMCRFVGKKTEVDNYVCFGYNDAATDCRDATNDYSYRIIGITQTGQLKLIKNTSIIEGSVRNDRRFVWLSSASYDLKWPQSILFNRLNGSSGGATTGATGNSNLFINSTTSSVNYIKSSGDTTWYSKIENHLWKYGDMTDVNKTANEMYNIENGFGTTTQARIGLMNVSDLCYSYVTNGIDSSSNSCYSHSETSWLELNKNGFSDEYGSGEWTMVRSPEKDKWSRYLAWAFSGSGDVETWHTQNSFVVRPVFYLTTEASRITDGKGTASEPFIIAK